MYLRHNILRVKSDPLETDLLDGKEISK